MSSNVNINILNNNDKNFDLISDFKNLKGIKIINLNIQSVVNKISELKSYCEDINPDIISLTESWLKPKHFDIEFDINGYILYRKDRITRGGGIAVYAKNGLNFTHEEVVLNININFEILIIKICQKISKPFYILNVYFKPNSMNEQIIEEFNQILEKFLPNECIIIGDINIDLISNSDNKWVSNLNDYGFKQLISKPTRVLSILDHIYTNCPNNISGSGVLGIGISDHFPIFFGRKLRFNRNNGTKNEEIIYYRNYKSMNCSKIEKMINNIKLNDKKDLNKSCNDFNQELHQIMNKELKIKSKRIKIQTKDNWISGDILLFMKNRDKAKRVLQKSIKNNSNLLLIEDNRKIYKDLRNKTRILIRKSKKNYNYNKISECEDNRKLWKFLTKLVPNKNSSKYHLNQIDAQKLNDSFIDERDCLIRNEIFSIPDSYPEIQLKTKEIFSIPEINEQNIRDITKKMSIKKATGSDGLSAKFIKTFLSSLMVY